MACNIYQYIVIALNIIIYWFCRLLENVSKTKRNLILVYKLVEHCFRIFFACVYSDHSDFWKFIFHEVL